MKLSSSTTLCCRLRAKASCSPVKPQRLSCVYAARARVFQCIRCTCMCARELVRTCCAGESASMHWVYMHVHSCARAYMLHGRECLNAIGLEILFLEIQLQCHTGYTDSQRILIEEAR